MSANTLRAVNDVSELRRIAYEANIPLPSISSAVSVFEIRDMFFAYLQTVLYVKSHPSILEVTK